MGDPQSDTVGPSKPGLDGILPTTPGGVDLEVRELLEHLKDEKTNVSEGLGGDHHVEEEGDVEGEERSKTSTTTYIAGVVQTPGDVELVIWPPRK